MSPPATHEPWRYTHVPDPGRRQDVPPPDGSCPCPVAERRVPARAEPSGANNCLTTWDQRDGETYVDSDCDGVVDDSDTDSTDDCKQGGCTRFTAPAFKHQGQCVAHHARG